MLALLSVTYCRKALRLKHDRVPRFAFEVYIAGKFDDVSRYFKVNPGTSSYYLIIIIITSF